MKIFTILIVFFLSLFGALLLNAEIYTWTDKDGVKHFSDQPPEGVERYKAVSPAFQHDEAAVDVRPEDQKQHIWFLRMAS